MGRCFTMIFVVVSTTCITLCGQCADGSRVERLRNTPPPLTRFPVVSSSLARGLLKDKELVIGIEVDGQSRAYPLNLISRPERELINDTLAGQPILVSWCKLCFNAIVFSRSVDQRVLAFQVYGVWNGSMAFRDLQTESVWSQLNHSSIKGPLQGRQLKVLPSVLTDWKTWRTKHEDTKVVMFTRLTHRFSLDSYTDPADFVLGVSIQNIQRHYPFSELIKSPVVNQRLGRQHLVVVYSTDSSTAVCFDAEVGNRILSFVLRNTELLDQETQTTWDPVTGRAVAGPLSGSQLQQLPGIVSFREDWERFYPQSEAWRATSTEVSVGTTKDEGPASTTSR